MTGRDLIIYILENNLENEQVFEDGRLMGFMTVPEAAFKFGVGMATIEVLFKLKAIPGFKIDETIYIPANAEYSTDIPVSITQLPSGKTLVEKRIDTK